jgi:hypothetical protein
MYRTKGMAFEYARTFQCNAGSIPAGIRYNTIHLICEAEGIRSGL